MHITNLKPRYSGQSFPVCSTRALSFEDALVAATRRFGSLSFDHTRLQQLTEIRDAAYNHRIPLDIGKEDEIGYDEDGQWWWGGEYDSPDDFVELTPDTYVGFVVAAVNIAYGSEAWKRIHLSEVEV